MPSMQELRKKEDDLQHAQQQIQGQIQENNRGLQCARNMLIVCMFSLNLPIASFHIHLFKLRNSACIYVKYALSISYHMTGSAMQRRLQTNDKTLKKTG